ncbi:MAG TPA: peptidase E [Gemmatimonadaceae bacterium]|nr:peptidase E [Gemmatimonadaceae bacterium]
MKKPLRQIIAIGGGGFTAEGESPAIESYILARARRANPRVCFLATATGDAPTYVAKFYAAFSKLRCRPTHIPLFERTPDLRSVLLEQDVIYVGGGNTKSMLAVWRDWQIPALLRRAWNAGTVLSGISAGAICWFEYGITDSWEGHLAAMPCLGFLPGTGCPHYDGEVERKPTVHRFVKTGVVQSVLAIDDGAAAHFVGRSLMRVVASRATAGAYRVGLRRTLVVERLLPVQRLRAR